MYDSGITVAFLKESILDKEVDIAGEIPMTTWMRWISSLEQLLYADIFSFCRSHDVAFDGEGFSLDKLVCGEGEAEIVYDDLIKLYEGKEELVRCGTIAAWQFEGEKPIFWQEGNEVRVRLLSAGAETLHAITRVRPELKSSESETVKVPYEWLDMVLAKLRGEAYKLVGDDAQAAKWLADYNNQLEAFKLWVAERQKRFGE